MADFELFSRGLAMLLGATGSGVLSVLLMNLLAWLWRKARYIEVKTVTAKHGADSSLTLTVRGTFRPWEKEKAERFRSICNALWKEHPDPRDLMALNGRWYGASLRDVSVSQS